MTRRDWLAGTAGLLAATGAHAGTGGYEMDRTIATRSITVADPVQGATIPLTIVYPGKGAPERVGFGLFHLDAVKNAKPDGRRLPLVVLSHGTGGNPAALLTLAGGLARAGYVVVLPEHIGNSISDNKLDGTVASLQNRPRHVKLTIDAVLADAVVGRSIDPARIAGIGHSMGGYTVLAAAGGKPWTGPRESAGKAPVQVEVTVEPRIKALVLLAPAAFWFAPPGSLGGVRVPILMLTGELDQITPASIAAFVKRDVAPGLVTHEVVPRAGHFSFLSPFPSAMRRPDFPPSQDPAGFDREAFQPILVWDIVRFLEQRL